MTYLTSAGENLARLRLRRIGPANKEMVGGGREGPTSQNVNIRLLSFFSRVKPEHSNDRGHFFFAKVIHNTNVKNTTIRGRHTLVATCCSPAVGVASDGRSKGPLSLTEGL